MKKLSYLFVLMMVGGLLRAQTSQEIFDAALVPNAPFVLYANGAETAEKPFVKLLEKYQLDFKAILSKNSITPEQEKAQKIWKDIQDELKLKDDDIVKWQISAAIGGMQFGVAAPDLSQLDLLIATELKTALNPEQIKTAALNADKKYGDGTTPDNADLVVGERNGVKLLSIIIKETDDTAEIPSALRRLQCGFVAGGKILVFGLEKSVFAAIDRIVSKTAAPKHPYIQKLFNDKEYGFLAIGMFSQAKSFLGNVVSKGQEGDPTITAAKAIQNADGISLTFKITDKMTAALNLDLGTSEDATTLKGQLWDAMVAPMIQQFKPAIVGAVGGALPLLDTLKCVCAEKRLTISVDVTEPDVTVFLNVLKNKAKEANPADAAAE